MANSIIMPKTGMAMESGVLVEWKVKKGDKVLKGDVVAVIETDKSTMELESDYSGVILALLRGEGETVPVTEVLAWVGGEGEAIPVSAPGTATPMQGAGLSASTPAFPAQGAEASPPERTNAAPPPRAKATPAARRLARENGADISSAVPGGKYGEIRAKDIETLIQKTAPGTEIPVQEAGFPAKEIPLTNVQRITGRRMLESRQTIPDVTLHAKADITEMLALRKRINEQPELKITINDFVLAAVAKALPENPKLNSVFSGNRLICGESVNLGIAVASKNGLVVPVLRRAEEMTLAGISRLAADLAARARAGKLAPGEMQGGSFTVSNLGMFGVTMFTPIINPPEAAILGVCAAEETVRFVNGEPRARTLMGLSLAFDHRVVDGAEAALFLKAVKDLLEAPLMILL